MLVTATTVQVSIQRRACGVTGTLPVTRVPVGLLPSARPPARPPGRPFVRTSGRPSVRPCVLYRSPISFVFVCRSCLLHDLGCLSLALNAVLWFISSC